ncbi:MAG TPA: hypothetical protein VLA83_12565 [Candidatus Binatia bacterium]|nr:hypothetical protein [Candidatus Binatia bacterium]
MNPLQALNPLESLNLQEFLKPLESLKSPGYVKSLKPVKSLKSMESLKSLKAVESLKPLEQAFKAADIVIQNGGLGLIVIDLGEIEERLVRKIPLTTWFRFARVIEKQPTALVVFATYPAAQSCASLTLHIKHPETHWNTETKSEAGAHSNQQSHSDLRFAGAQERGEVQQQITGVHQQSVDEQQQVIENACQADHKAITHAQFLSGLTYEVEVGRVRGQWGKPAQSSGADLWRLKHGSEK